MYRVTRHWSVCAWIACLAILFNALAPIVSQAMVAPASIPMEAEVCTALGMVKMSLTPVQAGEQSSSKPGKGMMRCDCCIYHAASLGLPPASIAVPVPSAGRGTYPPLYYHAPRPLFSWFPAQPRAPPFLA